jgi:hypothetical protein
MGEGFITRRGGAGGDVDLVIEEGLIVLYSGVSTNIPTGFVICDGNNGTPNLRDKFIVGSGDVYSIGNTGGSQDTILVTHTHTGTTDTAGAHTHTFGGSDFSGGNTGMGMGSGNGDSVKLSTSDNFTHEHTLSISTVGESGTGKNLPPYLSLLYIMKKEVV